MLPGFVNVSPADMAAVAPEIALIATGVLLILLDAFARSLRPAFPAISLGGLAVALYLESPGSGSFFSAAIETSDLTRFIDILTLAAVALAILWGSALLARDRRNQGEFYALLLWSAAGLMLMVKGSDLLVVFIGLELMSFALYILAAWYRDIPASVEAGMKYFLVGALASAFLLFGVATIYGRTGTTHLNKLLGLATRPELAFDPLLKLGVLAVVAALAFKIALVPFHSWAPDVYQGMTSPAVAFLSTAPKAGAVVVLVRFLHAVQPAGLGAPWRPLLGLLAVASILFGNIVALSQRDVKRMLAYSGIAQMGYVAIGLATFSDESFQGILVFLAGYLVTNAAAFLSLAVLSRGEREPHALHDLVGAGRRQPVAASILSVAMLSLAGVPPTVGFIGKFFVFRAAIAGGMIPLALVGVFGSIVSVGYYLRVVYTLFMKEPGKEMVEPPDDVMSGAAYVLSALGMLALGLFPGWLIDITRAAASALPLGLPR